MSGLIRFIAELSRRKVLRATGGYIVAVWLLSTGVADLFPAFDLPDWTVKAFVSLGVLGIPVVALVSWHFNLTARGFVRDPKDEPAADPEAHKTPADAAKWAARRHDPSSTGHLTLRWADADGAHCEERYLEPVVIGRDVYSDIQLLDQRVSRRHVVLWAQRGVWHVRDLESSNGTFVDGRRITTATLPQRCEIRLDRHGPRLDAVVDMTERTLISVDGQTTIGSPSDGDAVPPK